MTEIEKAIETLNVMESQYNHIRHSDAEFDAVEQAKDALRSQQEREKGCEYCTGELSKLENHHTIHTPSGWVVETDMKYCWNCGRRLKEAQSDAHPAD